MGQTQSVRASSGFATFLLAVLLLAPAVIAQPNDCKGEGVKTVTVTISGEEHTITANPTSVTIDMQGHVCWDVEGMEAGQEMVMVGKAASDDQFPERSVSAPKSIINSGSPKKPGTFHYSLILRAKGKEISKLDPEIIIDPPGG